MERRRSDAGLGLSELYVDLYQSVPVSQTVHSLIHGELGASLQAWPVLEYDSKVWHTCSIGHARNCHPVNFLSDPIMRPWESLHVKMPIIWFSGKAWWLLLRIVASKVKNILFSWEVTQPAPSISSPLPSCSSFLRLRTSLCYYVGTPWHTS